MRGPDAPFKAAARAAFWQGWTPVKFKRRKPPLDAALLARMQGQFVIDCGCGSFKPDEFDGDDGPDHGLAQMEAHLQNVVTTGYYRFVESDEDTFAGAEGAFLPDNIVPPGISGRSRMPTLIYPLTAPSGKTSYYKLNSSNAAFVKDARASGDDGEYDVLWCLTATIHDKRQWFYALRNCATGKVFPRMMHLGGPNDTPSVKAQVLKTFVAAAYNTL